MDRILLIEDDVEERAKVKPAIEKIISEYGLEDVVTLDAIIETEIDRINDMFPEDIENSLKTNALEDRLAHYLNSQTDIKLIVIDHDLSKYNDNRLSEPVISIASHAASIPLVRYARINRKPVDNLSDAVEAGSEFSIKVDINNPYEAAKKIINIYDGFKTIKESIKNLEEAERHKGPSNIIANITEAKTQEDNFWMYVSGANLLKELIEFQDVENKAVIHNKKELIIERLSYVMGYWLYNIVLTFPGVILNKIATSSYLHISEEDLEANKKYFEKAKYKGPFFLTEDYWWKEFIDEILDEEDVEIGFELLKKNGVEVEKKEFGYYCVMTQKQISFENSKSLSWLPNGAILSRVNEDLYDQYAPFFGEY